MNNQDKAPVCRRNIHSKKYRRNRLSRRIRNHMTRGNAVSVFITLIVLAMITTTLVGFLGNGFTEYAAKNMAEKLGEKYDNASTKEDFRASVDALTEAESGNMDVTLFNDLQHKMVADGSLDGLHNVDMEVGSLAGKRYFEYRIFIHGAKVYDSFEEDETMGTMDELSVQSEKVINMFGKSNYPILSADGNRIGEVEVYLSPIIILITLFMIVAMTIIYLLVNTVVNHVITAIASRMISKPIESLVDQMECLANEELEDAFSTNLVVKRPVSEVSSLMSSTGRIMEKMSEYYQTMLAQNQELEAQRDILSDQRDELEAQRDELEAQNEEMRVTGENLQSMNNAYLNRTLKLQNLMDNIGQGFMTFNEDLKINAEYSLACPGMLQDNEDTYGLAGKDVTTYLSPEPEEQAFLASLLLKVIKGSAHERELFLPLLPDELFLNDRYIHMDYKIVKDEQFKDKMMVILTDITMTRHLEERIEEERDTLQMIVKVLLNREEVIDNLLSLGGFLSERDMLTEDTDDMLRTLHTFKGTFSQYYMKQTVSALDDIENRLYAEDEIVGINEEEVIRVKESLALDMAVIESYAGSDFFKKTNQYTVNEASILQIEEKIRKILPASELSKVIPIIRSIRYKSVKDCLKSYPDYVAGLSGRLGKSVLPFEITGDEVMVDMELYQKLFKSLVHLFRNAVDHGIEDVDTRIMKGKAEEAVISCKVEAIGHDRFAIEFTDDGRGMDPENIWQEALARGLVLEEDKHLYPDEEKLMLIFKQGFSTKVEATAISGRGVGLAAFKNLVDHLEGSIHMTSTIDRGTRIRVELPLLNTLVTSGLSSEAFVDEVAEVANVYLHKLGLDFPESVKDRVDRLSFKGISAIINIKGIIDGLVLVSSNTSCARALTKTFVLDEVNEEEVMTYAEDVLGEVTNTILGNVMGRLEDKGMCMNLGVPVMLTNTEAHIKYSNRQIHLAHYEKDDKIFTIGLLTTDSGLEENLSAYDEDTANRSYEGGL